MTVSIVSIRVYIYDTNGNIRTIDATDPLIQHMTKSVASVDSLLTIFNTYVKLLMIIYMLNF